MHLTPIESSPQLEVTKLQIERLTTFLKDAQEHPYPSEKIQETLVAGTEAVIGTLEDEVLMYFRYKEAQ